VTEASIGNDDPGRAFLATTAAARVPFLPGLSNPTVLLCMAGIVLPNLLSLGAMLFGIGSPPRTTAILAYAALAVSARNSSPKFFVPIFVLIVFYDAISTLSASFNLMPHDIFLALNLGAELNLLGSPFYVALIFGLSFVVLANIVFLVWQRHMFRTGSALSIVALAMLFAAADYLANASPHYAYGTYYASGKQMESASTDSGFAKTLLTKRPDRALLIMIEALGVLEAPDKQALVMQAFRDADLLRRYDVEFGTTTYYGSTTAAEMRELCNSRASYLDEGIGRDFTCLPERLRKQRYRTVSLHNFTGTFFDRPSWYPKVGFDKSIFLEDLKPLGLRECGVPFRGPCDIELVPLIAKQLREAHEPIFLYWLTLTTHIPIAPGDAKPLLGCEHRGGIIGQRDVCHMAELWIELFEALARMTADIPPTEILIVGDHAPPLWPRAGRMQFTPGKVPWIRLTPRVSRVNASR
jgi:hypothetical protein